MRTTFRDRVNSPAMEHPFTEDDKTRITNSINELDEAEKLLKAGKLAGLDLDEQQARLTDIRKKLRKVKQVFFPNA